MQAGDFIRKWGPGGSAHALTERAGDPAILIASSERIRRELGWTPQYPDLRSIIESAWKWHLAHPNGYNS